MRRQTIINILLFLFLAWFTSPVLFAGEKASYVIGTYIETETNNEAYALGNLVVVPALKFRVSGNNIPLYFQYIFEHRDIHYDPVSSSKYGGNELRNRLHLGYPFNFGDFSFNPEYELRIKYYVGISPMDLAVYENRFHLNTRLETASGWSVYLDFMPTLILDLNDNRLENSNPKLYTDYYHEAEIGSGFVFDEHNSIKFGIYNEFGINSVIRSLDGSLNNGESFSKNEYQARLYYTHRFPNGVVLSPYARIGLYRKYSYEEAGGNQVKKDYRRDRYGFNVSSSLKSGLKPFFEGYYQYSNMGDGPDLHRMMLKVGIDYSF